MTSKARTGTARTTLDQRAPPAPDANALELFARIAAAGSFAQAARQLGLTRAAISRRVLALEAQLGVPLFTRSTRAIGLTEAGRRLAARARAVLDAAESARSTLRSRGSRGADAAAGLAGTLRITAPPSLGSAVLAPLLVSFQAQHPALRIEMRFTNRRVDLVREDIDVAFRLTRRPPEDCVATPLLPFVVHAWAAPGPGLPLKNPQALAKQRCLLFGAPVDEMTLQWTHHPSGRRESVAVEPAMVGDDLATLQAVAAAGGGIVFSPDYAVRREVESGVLIDALPGWRLPVAEGDVLQALTLPHAVAPESARALVKHVRSGLMSPQAR